MSEPKAMTFKEQVLFYIQFQLNKHGQYNGWTTPEEVINHMTNWERCKRNLPNSDGITRCCRAASG